MFKTSSNVFKDDDEAVVAVNPSCDRRRSETETESSLIQIEISQSEAHPMPGFRTRTFTTITCCASIGSCILNTTADLSCPTHQTLDQYTTLFNRTRASFWLLTFHFQSTSATTNNTVLYSTLTLDLSNPVKKSKHYFEHRKYHFT